MNEQRSSSAFFEELYAVVVGLGLALAVEQVIDLGREGIPVRGEHVFLFIAYLNFAFTLAHASVRYLDHAYEHDPGQLTKAKVLGDLVLGAGQFLWILALSLLVTRPTAFALIAAVLLVGFVLRNVAFSRGSSVPDRLEGSITAINSLTVVLLLALAAVTEVFLEGEARLWTLRLGTLAISTLYALGLYLRAFDFFFPNAGRPAPTKSS